MEGGGKQRRFLEGEKNRKTMARQQTAEKNVSSQTKFNHESHRDVA